MTEKKQRKQNTKAWKTDLKTPTRPPLMVNCFKCGKEFGIKWVPARKAWSQKNNWEYWTGEWAEKDIKDKQMCDNCLIHFYRDDKPYFWSKMTDSKKRDNLNRYINSGSIRAS
jgi:hypothetical protein